MVWVQTSMLKPTFGKGKGFGKAAGKSATFASAAAGGGGFKTKLCNYFQQGSCTRGAACTYAHGPRELQGGAVSKPATWTPGVTLGKGAATKGSWAQPVRAVSLGKGFVQGLGKGFQGKGKGKGFGKGKGKRRGNGHLLPRERITAEPVTGEVLEWKGKFGWIQPTVPVDHPKAEKHEGKIFVSMSDLTGIAELTPGTLCQFHVFADPSGLGAEEVVGS